MGYGMSTKRQKWPWNPQFTYQKWCFSCEILGQFYNKMDLLRVELIWSTYYGTSIRHACDPCGSFWWHCIMKPNPIFCGISRITIRCDTTTLFWKDMWLNDLLSISHARAFSFTSQDISVNTILKCMSLGETLHLPLSMEAHSLWENENTSHWGGSFDKYSWLLNLYLGIFKYCTHKYYAFLFRYIYPHLAFK